MLNNLMNSPKIDENTLEKYSRIIENDDLTNFFGDWVNNIDQLKRSYVNSKPFSHIKISNFLNNDYAEEIFKKYPNDFENWHKYYNPLEVKYANDSINSFDKPIKDLFYFLSSKEIVNIFSEITNIKDLTFDPYLHGAGLHCHPRNGRLNMHLDYEKHPKLENMERRLNIILFLNKDWKEEWNGDNQLWDKDMKKCVVRSYPEFNRAIIFQTNDISWHGVPDKIMCPDNVFRKSLAYYYISPLVSESDESKFGNDGSGFRTKATFTKRPDDEYSDKMDKLFKIRPFRRIEPEDMNLIWPEWNPIDN